MNEWPGGAKQTSLLPYSFLSKISLVVLSSSLSIAANAHPMGNFSVNRWTKLVPRAGGVDVSYLVDFAEVPTQTELAAARLTAQPVGAAAQEFARALAARLSPNLVLEENGARVALALSSTSIEFVSGVAGLPTMRLRLELKAEISGSGTESKVRYSDGNFAGRVGWNEVIAAAGPGASLVKSSVPPTDRSRGLTDYPTDPAEPPSEITSAELIVRWSASRLSK